MSDLRRDPISGRWVIVAPERAARPSDFVTPAPAKDGGFCPFCPGNEDATPDELLRVGGDAAWSVRVFPNRFPAVRIEGDLDRRAEGIYDLMNGVGAHEVIVETPRHGASLADVSIPELAQALGVWRDRVVDLAQDLRLRHVQIFKNHGSAAGATLHHEHSQLLALPVVPPWIEAERARAQAWYAEKERCLVCDLLRQEGPEAVRIVARNDAFVALCPFASITPFQLWILPAAHASHFEHIGRGGLDALASLLRTLVRKVDAALERPAYNFVLTSGPLRGEASPALHWRLEIAPAMAVSGGFERATGCYINAVAPEEAARVLREAEG